ncbi:phosphatase PAP2 family protein [Flavobacterium ardleyense]|uniref:Phosphatase PAP2 family protein n=1 Tax=Flavobacterium ardleyense TaxID=2038737 RepID=A0ABW5ZCZ5_9FLAO
MEQLLQLDQNLLVFLNGLGSEPFDAFWKIITKQAYWAPFFLAVFFLIHRKVGSRKFIIIIVFLALLIAFTDQMTNLFKYTFQRLRPCNVPELDGIIRKVVTRKSFSFFSGHAANSMASTVFIFLIIRKYYRNTFLLFAFPLIFAYSRIYLGLHFPGDILSGYLFGAIVGIVFYKFHEHFSAKYKITKRESPLVHP